MIPLILLCIAVICCAVPFAGIQGKAAGILAIVALVMVCTGWVPR